MAQHLVTELARSLYYGTCLSYDSTVSRHTSELYWEYSLCNNGHWSFSLPIFSRRAKTRRFQTAYIILIESCCKVTCLTMVPISFTAFWRAATGDKGAVGCLRCRRKRDSRELLDEGVWLDEAVAFLAGPPACGEEIVRTLLIVEGTVGCRLAKCLGFEEGLPLPAHLKRWVGPGCQWNICLSACRHITFRVLLAKWAPLLKPALTFEDCSLIISVFAPLSMTNGYYPWRVCMFNLCQDGRVAWIGVCVKKC